MGREGNVTGRALDLALERPAWLGRLVHDLRGPLAPAAMAVALLQSGRADAQRQAELCAVIQRQLEALTQLLDDTGDLLSAQPRKLQPIELPSLLNMLRVRTARRLAALEAGLEVAAAPPPAQIDGDMRELLRLVGGLVLRCAEIGGRESRVRLDAEMQPGQLQLRLGVTPARADNAACCARLAATLLAPVQEHVADAVLAALVQRYQIGIEALPDGLMLRFVCLA